MKTTLEKVTAVVGFINIAFYVIFMIIGICGITLQGVWTLQDKLFLAWVVTKACVVPLVWAAVTIIIQILFIKGKRTASLFMGLLLGAHVFELLTKMQAIINNPMDYLVSIFIYGFLIAGFIVGLITAKKGKAYFILLTISYAIWVGLFYLRAIKTTMQILDPSITFVAGGFGVFIECFMKPIVLMIAITLFGYFFLLPQKKEIGIE